MRYAILAGSNYVGTANALKGCINDMDSIRQLIEPSGVTIVADLRDKEMSCHNWKAVLEHTVSIAEPGDVVFHAHSHHGTQIKDTTEPDGLAESWCPDNFSWSDPMSMITDDYMADLISHLKTGVRWLDLADCCHSADSIRQMWCPGERPRRIDNVRLLGQRFNKLAPIVVTGADRMGILLAAARTDQTAADAFIGGRSCGAFTHFFLEALAEKPWATYGEHMIRVNELLGLHGYSQNPELDGPLGAEAGCFSKDVLGL